MKKLLLSATLMVAAWVSGQVWTTDEQYIQEFAMFAVEEMELYKIPASITLAQGLLETAGGQSILAQQGKNHFGIKCKKEWTGKTMAYTDDAPNECFRVYDSVRDSYRDHSKFLAERPYYKSLFTLDPKDYRAWAYGLKKAGYATSATYAPALIKKIEQYRLNDFDFIDSKEVYATLLKRYPDLANDRVFMAKLSPKKSVSIDAPMVKEETPKQIREEKKEAAAAVPAPAIMKVLNHPNGGLMYVVAHEQTSMDKIGQKFGISGKKLRKFNDVSSNIVQPNQMVFLQAKRSAANVKTYTVEEGDTMYMISQKFGIKLKKLYSKNRMTSGQRVKPGQVVYLKYKKPRS